jgi:glycosyltransferase involved in cell wall biosynthesis
LNVEESLVSIIIPSYNRAHLIGETLDSVLAQTYPHWECIVVDDCSTDGTYEVVKNYAKNDFRIKLFKRDREPKGANTCRNIGFEKSQGTYIQFFDSDDLMCKDYLLDRLNVLLENRSLCYCACNYIVFRSNGEINELYCTLNHSIEHNLYEHLVNFGITTQAFLLRKDHVQDLKLEWDEKIHRLQDIDYFFRIFLNGSPGFWIKKPLFKIRKHDETISNDNSKKALVSLIKVHRKIFWKVKKHHDKSSDIKRLATDRILTFTVLACKKQYYFVALLYFWHNWVNLPKGDKISKMKYFLWVFFRSIGLKPDI